MRMIICRVCGKEAKQYGPQFGRVCRPCGRAAHIENNRQLRAKQDAKRRGMGDVALKLLGAVP